MQTKIIPGCEPIYWEGNEVGCLLLHGFTSSPFELRFLGDYLKKEGYTVNIPLLPGHGTSVQNMRQHSWYDWFTSAKNELFNIRKKCRRLIVIGLSMGGSLALHLAAHYQVDGVVSLAPGMYLKNKFAKLSHILHPIYYYTHKNSRSDIKADEKTLTYNKIPLKSISELLKFFKHLKNDLADIYAPTLIIYSKQDHVIDGKSSIEIYNKISSVDKRILELQDSFHILTLDQEKEKVFQETASFIKNII
jgi:carboxylesterase